MNCYDLDCTDKYLLSEIISLHQLNNGCHASNEFFAELLNISRGNASKRITKLTNKGYIKTKNRYNRKKCIGRIIIPTDKRYVHYVITNAQSEENGGSQANQSVVPQRPEDGAQTTPGVVPERLGDSAQSQHINTINNTDIEKHILVQETGEISFDIIRVLKKLVISGWDSLAVKEARLVWDNKSWFDEYRYKPIEELKPLFKYLYKH